MDIRTIIENCGGAKRIADESAALGEGRGSSYRPVGVKAVYKWIENGCIPERHWSLVRSLCNVSIVTLHKANREVEGSTPERPSMRAQARAA